MWLKYVSGRCVVDWGEGKKDEWLMDHLKVIFNYNPNNSTSSSVDINLQNVRSNYAFEEEPIILKRYIQTTMLVLAC